MKIVVEQNTKGKWYWKIVARNGEILAHSEAYSSKAKCVKTVLAIIEARLVVREGK